MRIQTLFLLLFTLPIWATPVSLEITTSKDEDGTSKEYQIFSRGDSRLLMRLKRFSKNGSLGSDSYYYVFNDQAVLTCVWAKGKGYRILVEPNSPVMVDVGVKSSDGMVDSVVLEAVGGQREVMSYFYTEELGMIPAVSTILRNDQTVYEIDTSKRIISEITKPE